MAEEKRFNNFLLLLKCIHMGFAIAKPSFLDPGLCRLHVVCELVWLNILRTKYTYYSQYTGILCSGTP